jgi:DNA-binding response OmpR family regulator
VKVSLPDESKARVLIADDEPVIASTLEEILNQSGFDAIGVVDGASAVRTAEIWRPDILLSDVVMPGLDGFETAKRVRALLRNCRIFLFSAQADASGTVREYCAQGYAFEFIAKPVHPSELLSRLRASSSDDLPARAT